MKLVLALLAFTTPVVTSSSYDEKVLENQFHGWMKAHGKTYETTEEMLQRMDIWMANNVFIESHNNRNPAPSYTLGHNQFSDMTLEEYHEYNKLGLFSPGIVATGMNDPAVPSSVSIARRKLSGDPLPPTVDWVQGGAVVPVKNQGMCGSCWAFSAICAIEGAHYVDTGALVSLSEQELVDCDKLDMGCGGGLMDNAFLFDENSTGICSEVDYPYAGRKHWITGCKATKGLCDGVEHTRVKTFVDIENTVDGLMEALTKQPVSIAIEADQQSFQFYKSGVYDDPGCGNNLDHGVAAVGYGTSDDGKEYFVVRNSWGETWGDQGYIKMSRQSEQVNGTCGMLSFASRPILREDN